MIYFVLAATENGVIGNNNTLPWNIPEDMKIFKDITRNKTILMGRKTFDSINKKPLPKRYNIVLSRKNLKNSAYKNLEFSSNYISYARKYFKNNKGDLYVIGGKEIYNLFLKYCDGIYINIIKHNYDGDTFLDLKSFLSNFYLKSKKEHDEFYECFYLKRQ